MQDGYKSLIVWQKSVLLAKEVYRLTDQLPTRENFALADQMRRAAVSIPSNIAEGNRRSTKKDYAHFISIAHGSLAELETQLLIAHDRYPKVSFQQLNSLTEEVSRMLFSLGNKLRG